MNRFVPLALAGGIMALSLACGSDADPSWSYGGKTGPEQWASLDDVWEACDDGDGQTPIDLRPTPADLPDVLVRYDDTFAEIVNNGHTVEAEAREGTTNAVTIDGVDYGFLQMHFHAPSEHAFRGTTYPVEVHFVNKSEDGVIAVIGLFIERGSEDNEAWAPFIEHLAVQPGDDGVEAEIDFAALLPSDRTTIQYAGSLTTPPCSTGVRWNVMSSVVRLSDAQIARFEQAYLGNNRPIQPTGDRTVQIDESVDGG
jgi:carbonic anhydrase